VVPAALSEKHAWFSLGASGTRAATVRARRSIVKRVLLVLVLMALGSVSFAPNAARAADKGKPAEPRPAKPKPHQPNEPPANKPCPKPTEPSPGEGIFGRRLCP